MEGGTYVGFAGEDGFEFAAPAAHDDRPAL